MRVININRKPVDPGYVYIGRGSVFGNPFRVGLFSRLESIRRYEDYARNTPRVLLAIRELPRDAVLGCFCYPARCHGDVIVKLWGEMHPDWREG